MKLSNWIKNTAKQTSILSVMFLMVFGLAVSGCNTTEGIGEDAEDAGDAIEDVTDDAVDAVDDAIN